METKRERYSVVKGKYRPKKEKHRKASPIVTQTAVSVLLVCLGVAISNIHNRTTEKYKDMLSASLTVGGDLGDVSEVLKTFSSNLKEITNDSEYVSPLEGYVTDSFGKRVNPVTQEESFHYGVDIAAAEGTPITAARDGQAVYCGDDEYYGNYIILKHGEDVFTVYGHCKEILIKEGDDIKSGDEIGTVGSSGQSTGNHLHFGIKIIGEYVDPKEYKEL